MRYLTYKIRGAEKILLISKHFDVIHKKYLLYNYWRPLNERLKDN